MPGAGKLSVVQQVATILAVGLLVFYGKSQDSFLVIPALVLGVLAVILWLVKRLLEANLYEKALRLAERGDHQKALHRLMTAERAWKFNARGTPETITGDFRRLAEIISAIQSQAHELGGEVDSAEIARVIGTYIDVYSDKENFVSGAHDLKAGAEDEIERCEEVFPVLRDQFRAACQELYKLSNSRPT